MTVKKSTPLSGYFYSKQYNGLRRSKLMLFSSVLLDFDEFKALSFDDKNEILLKIERSCYNYSIEIANKNNIPRSWVELNFCYLYDSLCSKVSFNIEKNTIVKNDRFGLSIINNTIDVNKVSRMSSVEMFPEKYEKIQEKLLISKSISRTIKTSKLHTCSVCGMSETTEEKLYNRSLDEGVNFTITCLNCTHKWISSS